MRISFGINEWEIHLDVISADGLAQNGKFAVGLRVFQGLGLLQNIGERRVRPFCPRGKLLDKVLRRGRIHLVERPEHGQDKDIGPAGAYIHELEGAASPLSRISVTDDLVTSILASAERKETVLSLTVITTPTI